MEPPKKYPSGKNAAERYATVGTRVRGRHASEKESSILAAGSSGADGVEWGEDKTTGKRRSSRMVL